MNTFIVAVPLFDKNMIVRAYKLGTHNSSRLLGTAHDYMQLGESLSTKGLDLVEKLGTEPFAGNRPLLLDINQYQLMMDIPVHMDLPFSDIVFVLPADTPHNDLLAEKINALKALGTRFALDSAANVGAHHPFVQNVDYILLDVQAEEYIQQLQSLKPFVNRKTLILNNIPDQEEFKIASRVPNALMGGLFYEAPLSSDAQEISPIKLNALELLRHVNEIDSDLLQIASTIERDPAISVALLRFINSPVVGVRQRIDSIRAAVAILGQKEIKRWTTVAVSIQLATDRPSELTKLSLVRAKFAENLARAFAIGSQSASLFLTGLFSLLDVILEMPMEAAVQEVALDDKVREALVLKHGPLYNVIELVQAYERADWDAVSISMIKNNLEADSIIRAFIDALTWYKQLLEDIDYRAR